MTSDKGRCQAPFKGLARLPTRLRPAAAVARADRSGPRTLAQATQHRAAEESRNDRRATTVAETTNDEPSNFIVEHLKALRAEVAAVKADTSEMRTRIGQVETGIAGLRRDFAHADGNTAIPGVRLDRLIEPMDRLEKRLELA